jgi:pilus assembly protein CpaE
MEDVMQRAKETAPSVLVIASHDPTSDWIQLSLDELGYKVAGSVDSAYQALQVIERTPLDIILADSSGHGVSDTGWIQRLAVQSMGTGVIVMATDSEMEFVRQAMLAGAQGFLLKPFDLPELHKSIQQVYQLSLQRKAALAEVRTAPDLTAAPANKAYCIAVFSSKGGTGATTLAVNLAVALKQQTDSPVLLVDADLRTADVDIFLSVLSKHSIYDLIELGQKIDKELLEQVVTRHASGITVLRGEPQLQLDIPVEPGQMNDMVEALSSIWEGYIVINTGDGLDRWTVEILDIVDTVLVVTTPELPALRATRNFLELADAAADPSGKWQLVMSSYQGKQALHIADIEASIHYPIKATVAEDIAVVSASINRGTPLMVSHRKSPIAQDVLALAKQLADAKPGAPKSQSADSKQSVHAEEAPNRSEQSGKRASFWRSLANSVRLPAG